MSRQALYRFQLDGNTAKKLGVVSLVNLLNQVEHDTKLDRCVSHLSMFEVSADG